MGGVGRGQGRERRANQDPPPIFVFPVRNFIADAPDGVEFVPIGPRLPAGKPERELFIAEFMAGVLQERKPARSWTNLRSSPVDPPDVVGIEDGAPFGIEIGEVKYAERAAGS